jgi:hypothetical protein
MDAQRSTDTKRRRKSHIRNVPLIGLRPVSLLGESLKEEHSYFDIVRHSFGGESE